MMISIANSTNIDLPAAIAQRVRERRVDRGWSRLELSKRAQVSPETLKAFERTGQISLRRLVRLSVALGCVDEWDGLFRPTAPTSLDEVEAGARRRQRGRTNR